MNKRNTFTSEFKREAVKRDVPLNTGLPELQFTGFNLEKTRALFTELEFSNLIKLIENGG